MKLRTRSIGIGCRVTVAPQHWLRAYEYEEGVIIDHQPSAQHYWLVRFERRYPGGGIDGDKLWLAENEFAEVKPASPAQAAPKARSSDTMVDLAPGHFDLH